MAKEPITIGPLTFNTQTAAREYIQEVLHRHTLKVPIEGLDHTFVFDLLNLHPGAKEKIGVGVKHFTVEKATGGTVCFYITRIDGSRDNFSFKNCIAPHLYRVEQ
jgi:hypothetical protein